MATYESYLAERESKEAIETGYLELENPNDVKVNIAIAGKAGSGRSSFVNAIRGLDENHENAARPTASEFEGKEPASYSHPDYPNINFSILPRMDQGALLSFKRFLDSVEVENFDVFLIFTAGDITRKHTTLAEKIKPSKKPFFFIQTKIDQGNHPEKRKGESVNESKDLDNVQVGHKVYRISNHHLDKWDFDKLTKAIADSLPSPQKECFNRIAITQTSITLEMLQSFLKGLREQDQEESAIPAVEDIERTLTESGIVGVQRMMIKKLEQWKNVKINLAILGVSGAGKSSFINAIRGVSALHPQAAKPGVTETTTIPTSYEFPNNPNILLWDLPGIGTPNYPNLQIFSEKVAIETYDTFLILCSTRFTQNDVELAKKVESMKKSFFFVRTKIDQDCANEKNDFGESSFCEKSLLKKIRHNCVENLLNTKIVEENIFLISNPNPTQWDFDRLKKAILDELPTNQKETFIMSLHANTENIVREKVKCFKERSVNKIQDVVKKSRIWPFSYFVNGQQIREIVEFYRSQLFRNSETLETLNENLQKRVKKFCLRPEEDLLPWLKSFDRNKKYVGSFRKYIFARHPMTFVHHSLKLILDEMGETALAILDEAAKSLNTKL